MPRQPQQPPTPLAPKVLMPARVQDVTSPGKSCILERFMYKAVDDVVASEAAETNAILQCGTTTANQEFPFDVVPLLQSSTQNLTFRIVPNVRIQPPSSVSCNKRTAFTNNAIQECSVSTTNMEISFPRNSSNGDTNAALNNGHYDNEDSDNESVIVISSDESDDLDFDIYKKNKDHRLMQRLSRGNAMHPPRGKGISPVNKVRSWIKQNSTNNFSTEDLYDDFDLIPTQPRTSEVYQIIDGINITLPSTLSSEKSHVDSVADLDTNRTPPLSQISSKLSDKKEDSHFKEPSKITPAPPPISNSVGVEKDCVSNSGENNSVSRKKVLVTVSKDKTVKLKSLQASEEAQNAKTNDNASTYLSDVCSERQNDHEVCHRSCSMSPESIRSEFYSYLKINTNPFAQKVETIVQNRRSNRVKFLMYQNELKERLSEKLKEFSPETKQNKEQTKNDESVPKKKYHQFPLLQNPVFKDSTVVDFDQEIITYFETEKIDYLKIANRNAKPRSDCKTDNAPKNEPARSQILAKPKPVVLGKQKTKKLKKRIRLKEKSQFVPRISRRALSVRVLRTRKLQKLALKQLLGNEDTGRHVKKKPLSKPNQSKKHKKGSDASIPKKKAKVDKPDEYAHLEKLDESIEFVRPVIAPLKTYSKKKQPVELQNQTKDNVESNPAKDSEETSPMNNNEELVQNRTDSHTPIPYCIGFDDEEEIDAIRKKIESAVMYISRMPVFQEEKNECKDSVNDTAQAVPVPETEPCTNAVAQTILASPISPVVLNDSAEEENVRSGSYRTVPTEPQPPKFISVQEPPVLKPFYRFLYTDVPKHRRSQVFETDSDSVSEQAFDTDDIQKSLSRTIRFPKRTHEIDIDEINGQVFYVSYTGYYLIVVQKSLVSFWKQTPLGDILGSQSMWIRVGSVQRKPKLSAGCINTRSVEKTMYLDSAVAYIEVWMKEHKSDRRERPLGDVFTSAYFYMSGHGGPDLKELQLETIKGSAATVKFIVIKHSRDVVVSWYDAFVRPTETVVRKYTFAADFQTLVTVKEFKSVPYYIQSLHNIADCDTLILGAGERNVTIWDLEEGYLIATVTLTDQNIRGVVMQSHPACLWARCDTGFLFLIHEIDRGVLQLAAVNGRTKDWKPLQTYRIPSPYMDLIGISYESGILITCYAQGTLFWEMRTGLLLTEVQTPTSQITLPTNKYIITVDNCHITVKHILSYLLTVD